jgi:Galactose oxidase, central domain
MTDLTPISAAEPRTRTGYSWHRPPPTSTRWIALVVPAVLLLGSLGGIGARSTWWEGAVPPRAALAASALGTHAANGAELLAQARQTLDSGNGPGITHGVLSGPNWTEVQNLPPRGREGASLVWDAKDHEYTLFGGWDGIGTVLRDTWVLPANGIWSKLTPSMPPSARWGSAIAYDALDGYVLLFGGQGPGMTGALGDTWKFSGGTWTKLNPPTHPTGTFFGSMSYDAKDGYVLLFGGYNATGARLGASWEFKGGLWTHLTPTTSPRPRAAAAMSFDAKDNYVLLFGGIGVSGITGDSWKFVGGNWTNITSPTAPQARHAAAMAYSVPDARVVLFGGLSSTGYLGQTWVFSGGNWTRLATAFQPSKRYYPALADAPAGGVVTLFGGFTPSGFASNETWGLSGSVWKKVGPLHPFARYGEAVVYDEADRFVLLFGGAATTSFLGDTWKFVGGVWIAIHPSTPPPARAFAGITYDQADGYVVMFGGSGCGSRCGDTWTFAHGVWTNVSGLSPPSAPGPRAAPSMASDAADGYVLLFGGVGPAPSFTYYNDSWTYLDGAWSMISPTSSPSPRAGADMTFDSEDGYVLLYEGVTATTKYAGDTWIFQAGFWDNISASLTTFPTTATFYDAFFDDTYDGHVVLWVAVFDETWIWDGTVWTEVFPSSAPPSALVGSGGAYDPSTLSGVVLVNSATWEYTG